MLCHNLIGHHLNDVRLSLNRQRQLLRRDGAKCMVWTSASGAGTRGGNALLHRNAVLVYGVYMHLLPVVQKHNVRFVTRRNGPYPFRPYTRAALKLAMQTASTTGMPSCTAWWTFQRICPSRAMSSRCLSSVQNKKRSVGRPLLQQALHNGRRVLAALPSRTRIAIPAASFSFASAKVVHSCSVSMPAAAYAARDPCRRAPGACPSICL